MKRILTIILAAGRGARAGAGLPKTYREYQGVPILRHSVETFLAIPEITTVQLVIHPDDQALYEKALSGLDLPPPKYGGDSRAESVKNGLEDHADYDYLLIHDGARPFVSHDLIQRVIAALDDHAGVIPAIPITDALWRVKGNRLVEAVDRNVLVGAQTPQGFHFQDYKKIAAGGDVLDDAQAALQAGLNVVYVEGEKSNRKLTYQEDFE